MSKHVDIIAIAVLLLAFVLAMRIHDKLHSAVGHVRLFQLRPVNPVVLTPYRTSSVRYEYRK
jgi:uncharacterized protein (DUF3084 family)